MTKREKYEAGASTPDGSEIFYCDIGGGLACEKCPVGWTL